MYRITMIALLLGLAGSAAAKPEKSVVQMDRQSPVAEQVRQVEKALDDGDYSEISADDRSTVREALARITARMGGHQSVQELPPQVQGRSSTTRSGSIPCSPAPTRTAGRSASTRAVPAATCPKAAA